MMVGADLGALQPREKRISLIGAGLATRIRFTMIDPLRQEACMKRIPDAWPRRHR